jgi:hypothetical protein
MLPVLPAIIVGALHNAKEPEALRPASQRLSLLPIRNATKSAALAWSIFANSPYIGA